MANLITVPSHYLRVLMRHIVDNGGDPLPILADLGISPEVYFQEDGMAHAEQFVALCQRIWQEGDDEFWGLTPTRCKPGLFALLVRYVGQFDRLQALIKEVCRFYNVTRDDIHFDFEIGERDVRFYIDLMHPEFDKDDYLAEFLLVCFHRFFCWITGKKLHLHHASFSYSKPKHYHLSYKHLFPCTHEFDQPHNMIVFGKEALKWPLIRNMEEINRYLQRSPADVMVIPGTDDSYTAQIKGLVLRQQRAGDGFPDFSQVASQLCVSPQTLRRKLQAESTSYQQIKDMLRRDLAIDKLIHENLSIAEIGQLLGFVEPASFTRAFKQWTGVSPAEYRLQAKS
jgi:AraC-like DNA-binding protein